MLDTRICKKLAILVLALMPLLIFLHYSDGEIKSRTLINYDDLDLIKPVLDMPLNEYFTTWLPTRDNHGYPLKDFSYQIDHWLGQKAGVPIFWFTQLLMFGLLLYGAGLFLLVVLPNQTLIVFSLVALLALHPLNIEVVQWLMIRKHLMAMLFIWPVTALVFSRRLQDKALSKRDWKWCGLAYLASILTFPTALLWLPWVLWMQRASLKKHLKARLLLWSLTGLVIGLYLKFTTTGEADYGSSMGALLLGEQIEKALYFSWLSLGRGFWNTLAPFWLAPYYSELSHWTVVGIVSLVTLTVVFFKWVTDPKDRRLARDVSLLGLVILAPSALVFIGFPDFVWADRYGFLVLPIFLVYLGLILKNIKLNSKLFLAASNTPFLTIASALVSVWIIFAVKTTVERVPLWRNAVTLMNECAMHEKSPKCLAQTAMRAIHIDGCSSLGPIIEMGQKIYAHRPRYNSEFKSEMPFYHAICIALSARTPPDEKLKKLPFLFDVYEGAGEVMFSIILVNVQAKDWAQAFANAKSYFFSGDPRPLSSSRNIVNIYRGAAKALCEFITEPDCKERAKQFYEANRKTPADVGYTNWGYNLVHTLAK